MRKLASIQIVEEIRPIENADALEHVRVLGWWVVGRKGTYNVGDKVVYIEVDSILPDTNPAFEFMKDRKYRVRTIRLRGALSQGLLIPMAEVLAGEDIEVGEDVTERLGITKYDPELAAMNAGKCGFKVGNSAGDFPSHLVAKTDETRIQSIPWVLKNFTDEDEIYVSVKCDGTSVTYLFDEAGEFCVCSRNHKIKRPDNSGALPAEEYEARKQAFKDAQDYDGLRALVQQQGGSQPSVYWQMAEKYDIENTLRKINAAGGQYALQGEICGPNIQGNKMGLKENELFCFNLFDTAANEHISGDLFLFLARTHGFPTVPMEYVGGIAGYNPDYTSVDAWLEKARGNYAGTNNPREGIVIRKFYGHYERAFKDENSFKAINNDFLEKNKE